MTWVIFWEQAWNIKDKVGDFYFTPPFIWMSAYFLLLNGGRPLPLKRAHAFLYFQFMQLLQVDVFSLKISVWIETVLFHIV